MRLTEIIKRLEALKNKGFIQSPRRGPTGVGHLFEQELGATESNIPIPDVGGRVELKGTRKKANSLITLFTFNRAVWHIKQKDLINKYGYVDEDGRRALYCTVNNKAPNSQGFYIDLDEKKNLIILKNKNTDKNLAEWSTYVLAGKFMTKMDRIILGFAENKEINGKEHFHFTEAVLLENPTPEKFLDAFNKSEMLLDIRMHLNSKGGVRNHGTGFRISEKNLMLLYEKKKKLI
jgi:hypothetical protein